MTSTTAARLRIDDAEPFVADPVADGEPLVLGPGGWSLVPEPVQAAAIGNASTFEDMLADPDWGALDTDAIAAFPGRILITSGDTGPDWLPHVARTVARRIEAPVQVIHGAGHTPHHTHPEAFAAAIIGRRPIVGRMTSDTKLPRRRLGASGLEAGAIGLGCMGMTWAYNAHERDDARSVAVIHRALDLGMDLIDTADMYGPFTNEEVVGRALAGRRDRAVLATKVGLVVEDRATYKMVRDGSPGARPRGHRRVAAAPRHRPRRPLPAAPRRPEGAARGDLGRDGRGRGRRQGARDRPVRGRPSTSSSARTPSTPSPPCSPSSRCGRATGSTTCVPWCRAHDVAFIPFAPLGRGYLTGTVTADSFDDRDFRARNPRFTREALDANLAIVDRVEAVAERHGATAAQVALAWVLAQDELILPIPGTTKVGAGGGERRRGDARAHARGSRRARRRPRGGRRALLTGAAARGRAGPGRCARMVSRGWRSRPGRPRRGRSGRSGTRGTSRR